MAAGPPDEGVRLREVGVRGDPRAGPVVGTPEPAAEFRVLGGRVAEDDAPGRAGHGVAYAGEFEGTPAVRRRASSVRTERNAPHEGCMVSPAASTDSSTARRPARDPAWAQLPSASAAGWTGEPTGSA